MGLRTTRTSRDALRKPPTAARPILELGVVVDGDAGHPYTGTV